MTTVVVAAAALAAAALAALAHASSSPPPTPFGGAVAVPIAHIGHIEVDLEPAGSAALRRVRCTVSGSGATACYVSAP